MGTRLLLLQYLGTLCRFLAKEATVVVFVIQAVAGGAVAADDEEVDDEVDEAKLRPLVSVNFDFLLLGVPEGVVATRINCSLSGASRDGANE